MGSKSRAALRMVTEDGEPPKGPGGKSTHSRRWGREPEAMAAEPNHLAVLMPVILPCDKWRHSAGQPGMYQASTPPSMLTERGRAGLPRPTHWE